MRLRIEESFYLRPVFFHDRFGFQMTSSREKLELNARASGKPINQLPRNIGIVFGVEHQNLRGRKLSEMVRGVVKTSPCSLFQFLAERRYPLPKAARMYAG